MPRISSSRRFTTPCTGTTSKTRPVTAQPFHTPTNPPPSRTHTHNRSVATRRHRWVNELVGWVSGLVFLAPFPGFRHIHLQHHKHTNVVDQDP